MACKNERIVFSADLNRVSLSGFERRDSLWGGEPLLAKPH